MLVMRQTLQDMIKDIKRLHRCSTAQFSTTSAYLLSFPTTARLLLLTGTFDLGCDCRQSLQEQFFKALQSTWPTLHCHRVSLQSTRWRRWQTQLLASHHASYSNLEPAKIHSRAALQAQHTRYYLATLPALVMANSVLCTCFVGNVIHTRTLRLPVACCRPLCTSGQGRSAAYDAIMSHVEGELRAASGAYLMAQCLEVMQRPAEALAIVHQTEAALATTIQQINAARQLASVSQDAAAPAPAPAPAAAAAAPQDLPEEAPAAPAGLARSNSGCSEATADQGC